MPRIEVKPEPEDLDVDLDVLGVALARLEFVPFTTLPLRVILAGDFRESLERWHALALNPQRAGGPVAGLVLPRGGADERPATIIGAEPLTGGYAARWLCGLRRRAV